MEEEEGGLKEKEGLVHTPLWSLICFLMFLIAKVVGRKVTGVKQHGVLFD